MNSGTSIRGAIVQNAWTPGPQFVEQSPLQRILFYGVTTLRVTWKDTWARRKALKSRQRANFMILEASAPPPSVTFLENFMIFEIRPHDHGCVCPYNFFVSQRPAVILSENDIQAPADRTILSEFLITPFSISKMKVKDRKRIDC